MRRTIGLVVVSLFITCCTRTCNKSRREMSADDVLQAYLEIAFNMTTVDQKDLLMSYTTGSLKAAISSASVDVVKKAYLDHRYQLERFSFIHREHQTPRETEITYLLVYKELPEGSTEFNDAVLVTTENKVSMIRQNQRWYIQAVLGNKSSIEFPLSTAPTITARPVP